MVVVVFTSFHFPCKSSKVSLASALFKVGKVAEEIVKEAWGHKGHGRGVTSEGFECVLQKAAVVHTANSDFATH